MTAEKKLQAIKDAKLQGVKPAERMWNTSPATIRYWRKQEEELSRLVGDNKGSYKHNGQTGRKLKHPELEMLLPQWINEYREKGKRITLKMVKKKAEVILQQLGIEKEVSLVGIWRIMKRNKYTIRRRSTAIWNLPKDVIPKCQRFVLYMKKMFKTQKFH